MRGIKFIISFVFISQCLWPSVIKAQAIETEEEFVPRGDYIGNLEIKAKLNSDSSLLITEEEEWIFASSSEPLEIIHSWPLTFEGKELKISDFSIFEINGYTQARTKINFQEETKDGLKKTIFKTQPRKKGEAQKYSLEYKVDGAVYRLNKENNRLRWWLWGNDFPAQVQNAKIVFDLPRETEFSNLNVNCYAGQLGSRKSCDEGIHITGAEGVVDKLVFREYNLDSGSGLMLDLNIPRDLADKYEYWFKIKNLLISNWLATGAGMLVLLSVAGFLVYTKKKKK